MMIGLASIGSLIAALVMDPPHLVAAGLAAALGWLACYACALQLECLRLKRAVEVDVARRASGDECRMPSKESSAPMEAAPDAGMDLDVTALARSLGSPFGNPLGSLAPGGGKSGQTIQA